MECPYCGNRSHFSSPQPLCNLPPESGIEVPLIQQCRRCQATLNPNAFVPGSPAYARARENKWGARK